MSTTPRHLSTPRITHPIPSRLDLVSSDSKSSDLLNQILTDYSPKSWYYFLSHILHTKHSTTDSYCYSFQTFNKFFEIFKSGFQNHEQLRQTDSYYGRIWILHTRSHVLDYHSLSHPKHKKSKLQYISSIYKKLYQSQIATNNGEFYIEWAKFYLLRNKPNRAKKMCRIGRKKQLKINQTQLRDFYATLTDTHSQSHSECSYSDLSSQSSSNESESNESDHSMDIDHRRRARKKSYILKPAQRVMNDTNFENCSDSENEFENGNISDSNSESDYVSEEEQKEINDGNGNGLKLCQIRENKVLSPPKNANNIKRTPFAVLHSNKPKNNNTKNRNKMTPNTFRIKKSVPFTPNTLLRNIENKTFTECLNENNTSKKKKIQRKKVEFQNSNAMHSDRKSESHTYKSKSHSPTPNNHSHSHRVQPHRNKPQMHRSNNNNTQNRNESQRLNVITLKGRKLMQLKRIGRGGSSEVFQVVTHKTWEILALKRILVPNSLEPGHSTHRSDPMQNFLNEIDLLTNLRNQQYCIQMIDYEIKDDLSHNRKEILMLFECGEIDLSRLLKQQKNGHFSDIGHVTYFWSHMLQAVHTVHGFRIVHGDLKPANFLMVKGRLKLIDFGIAKQIISNETQRISRDSQIGTLNYISPEALVPPTNNGVNEYKLGASADVWSLGCILHQMLHGFTPFTHLTNVAQKLGAIVGKSCHNYIKVHRECEYGNDIIRKCLMRVPSDRITMKELIEHQFVDIKGLLQFRYRNNGLL